VEPYTYHRTGKNVRSRGSNGRTSQAEGRVVSILYGVDWGPILLKEGGRTSGVGGTGRGRRKKTFR